jgi:AcrR family transcriptional regulator
LQYRSGSASKAGLGFPPCPARTAASCIAARGCASVNLREIAEEAGVALSQLNYYYKNKETLFSEVLNAMRQQYVSHVEERMLQLDSVQEKIGFLIDYNQHLLVSESALYRSFLDFFNLAMWSDSFRLEMNGFMAEIVAVIERSVQSAHEQAGPAIQPSPAIQARMILATSFGIAIQYLMNPQDTDIMQGFAILKTSLAV